jgi:hypothetical protein
MAPVGRFWFLEFVIVISGYEFLTGSVVECGQHRTSVLLWLKLIRGFAIEYGLGSRFQLQLFSRSCFFMMHEVFL